MLLEFFLTDLAAHYNPLGGFLAGAHSRDYNRVFGRDLLEEKYINPLLGRENKNNQSLQSGMLFNFKRTWSVFIPEANHGETQSFY